MPDEKHSYFQFPVHIDPCVADSVYVSDVELEKACKQLHQQGKSVSRRDIRYIAVYLLRDMEQATWSRMQRGGPLAFSLLEHELVEIQYLLDHGVNPLSEEELFENAHHHQRSHVYGLVEEHLHLLQCARDMGWWSLTLGDLILANPDGNAQVDLDMLDALLSEDPGLDFRLRGESLKEGSALQALRFFDKLEGK